MNQLKSTLLRNRQVLTTWLIGIGLFTGSVLLGQELSAYLSDKTLVISRSLFLSISMGLFIWLMVYRRSDKAQLIGISSSLFRGIGFFLLGMGLILVPLLLTLGFSALFGWAAYDLNPDKSILNYQLFAFIIVFLFEAFPEELLFRGYLFGRLRKDYSSKKAGFITTLLFLGLPLLAVPIFALFLDESTVFGGSQGITVGYMIYMFLFGLMTAFLRNLTGSVFTSMGFHLVFVFMNHLIGLGDNSLIVIVDYTAELPIQITLTTFIVIILVSLMAYSKRKSKRVNARQSLQMAYENQ